MKNKAQTVFKTTNLQKIKKHTTTKNIIAVTKTHPIKAVELALKNNINNIGENKIQETKEKLEKKQKPKKLNIHLIGHLQSNKAKHAVKLYDVIQTVDSIKIANKINQEAKKINKKQTIYIQINISKNSKQKGINPKETEKIIREIQKLTNIAIKGMMAIGPNTKNKQTIIKAYKKIKKLKEKQEKKFNLKALELSLGMSEDYKYALQEGATIIRIGTKIFGKRK